MKFGIVWDWLILGNRYEINIEFKKIINKDLN